jgi:hypothetical protein
MVEEVNSKILKLLQESLKLDRCGIRWGWCPDKKRDTFIFKMEFTLDELKQMFDVPGSSRMSDLIALGERCLRETEGEQPSTTELSNRDRDIFLEMLLGDSND